VPIIYKTKKVEAEKVQYILVINYTKTKTSIKLKTVRQTKVLLLLNAMKIYGAIPWVGGPTRLNFHFHLSSFSFLFVFFYCVLETYSPYLGQCGDL
jgi:hypothetical protein